MSTVRAFIFAVLAVFVIGSLAASAGYAWYLRSPACRAMAAAKLSDTLGLPADVGGIVPRSLTVRQFNDVEVWLPDRLGRALFCRQARVIQRPTRDDPDAYDLVLDGGNCEISPRTWLRRDYRSVLESGLRPGFSPDGPRRVRIRGMDISFEREKFALLLDDAAGLVSFDHPQNGSVAISCYRLNGHVSDEPVFLDGAFSRQPAGIQVDSIELTVPRLPLAILRLHELTGTTIDSGTFDGRLAYSESDGRKVLALSGHCTELDLAELTATLPRPWRGRCPEVELTELRVENRRPVELSFRGELVSVSLSDLLETLGFGGVAGEISLQVRAAEITEQGVERFVASGRCVGVGLESATAAIGLGRMSGELHVTIERLEVVDNRIAALDASVRVADATDPPNWIEGELLRQAAQRVLKLNLPRVLPERIEYTRLGLRLEVRDERLHVFGTHGEREKTILTARLFGVDWEVVKEPEQVFDLRGSLDDARGRLAELLRAPLAELERRTNAPPRGSTINPGPQSE